jgi:hypothetical protein
MKLRCVSTALLVLAAVLGFLEHASSLAAADRVGVVPFVEPIGKDQNRESDLPPERFVNRKEERKIPAAGLELLSLNNPYGSIRVAPSGSELVIVSAVFQTPESLQRDGEVFQVRSESFGKELRMGVGFQKEQSLQFRQSVVKAFKGLVELTVLVPNRMDLSLQTVDGSVEIFQLTAQDKALVVSTQKGAVSILSSRFRKQDVRCTACSVLARNSFGNLTVIGGTGDVVLRQQSGSRIFVSTTAGNIEAWNCGGQKVFVSKTGKVLSEEGPGGLSVSTFNGDISVISEGDLRIRSELGKAQVTLKKFSPDDVLDIETVQGPIQLSVPTDFPGTIDSETVQGVLRAKGLSDHAQVNSSQALAYLPSDIVLPYGPQPRLLNSMKKGNGDPICRIRSRSGSIEILPEPR